jgi:glycosyltransferase involved in cell wall biosynthesis
LRKIIIIDPLTSGVAGLYLSCYKAGLADVEIQTIAGYNSFDKTSLPYFYRTTELSAGGAKKFGRFRAPLRYIENIVGVARSFFTVAKKRPDAVWYALSTNLWSEYFFLLLVKLIGIKLSVICHDVVPYKFFHEVFSLKNWQRKQFYRIADQLIIHNENSREELTNLYRVDDRKIRFIPFPVMDIRPHVKNGASINSGSEMKIRFLFIGHLRHDKGIDLLIDAWRQVSGRMPNVELLIAGSRPAGVELGNHSDISGLKILDQFIPDDEYVDLIAEADVIVLPYRAGTNSGVLSNVVSLEKPVIVSDIAMFKQSGLVLEQSIFKSGDVHSLAVKLAEFANMAPEELCKQKVQYRQIRDNRDAEFFAKLAAVAAE